MPPNSWTSITGISMDPDRPGRVELHLHGHRSWILVVDVDASGSELRVDRLAFEYDPSSVLPGLDPNLRNPWPPAGLLRSVKMNEVMEAVNIAAGVERATRLPNPTKQHQGTPLYWASWSAAYVEATRKTPRSPIAALADKYSLERTQVRDLIHSCRERGYLTPGPAGRGGGQLTPLAIDELERKSR